jgi:hypothetical protein
MCHIGQTFSEYSVEYYHASLILTALVLIGSLQHGSCVIQPTVIAFSSEELIDMISRCHLNRLNQFPAFLMNHFRNARQDPKLLSILKDLDDIIYSGMPLSVEDEQWALKSGINLRVRYPLHFNQIYTDYDSESLRQHRSRWYATCRL